MELLEMLRWLFLPILWTLPEGGTDWPRWRGPDGNGISKETEWRPQALVPAPKVLWRNTVGVGHSSLIITGGRLYTMGNQGARDFVYCLDPEKGKLIWQFSYPCPAGNFPGPRATPALDGGFLYTLSRNGHAFCLEADTGKVKWAKDLIKDFGAKNTDYGITGSPLVVGDAVVYNASASGIALQKSTGEKVWASASELCAFASPVPVTYRSKDCAAVFSAGGLFIVDVRTGDRLTSYSWRTSFDGNAADPLRVDGKLFITSAWEHGCALLELREGGLSPVWENKNLRGHLASPIYLDGHIYGIDDNTPNGQLRCLEAATGQLKWAQKGGFENLMIAAGKILAIDKKGFLIVAEAAPAAYKEIARAAVLGNKAKNWTAPVLAGGLLYCRNGDGDLVCLDLR
jgi:outer membrane protein assembly factor BamB